MFPRPASTIVRLSASLLLPVLTACVAGGSGSGTVRTNDTNTATLDCSSVATGTSLPDEFICAHNAVRAAPPSPQPVPNPPLPNLTWNQKLADFAQTHANKCVYQHSDSNLRTSTFGQWVGENVAAGTRGAYTTSDIVNLWASEAANYDYTNNTCASGKVCGHYTQLVWHDTTQVGCAKATCPTLTNAESLGNADFWVCDYMPGGNIVGERPY